MLPVRNHLHHRIIITMSQKRKLLPAALGLLSLASLSVTAADALSLQGKTIGVAVVGTQHFWDREAFKGATEEVEKLGAKSLASMAAAIIRFMPIITIFYCHARWTR
jgi:ribose transport system substrate-binding protein